MNSTVYFNGEFVDHAAAAIDVHNGGWLHGAGLFETMRAENGKIFRLDTHMKRLRRSASSLLNDIDLEALPGEHHFAELLDRNSLKTARVRLTISAGSMSTGPNGDQPHLTVCATASPLGGYASSCYQNGVTVAICPFKLSPSDPLAGHKTTCYLPRLLALRLSQEVKCMETLWFTTANRLAEGSISNVFVAQGKTIKTPPLDTPVLPGIARGVVLEMARDLSIETRECPLTIDDVLDADEVFLTNALMQVMPVVRIEKHNIKTGRVGTMAKTLLTEYRHRVKKECG